VHQKPGDNREKGAREDAQAIACRLRQRRRAAEERGLAAHGNTHVIFVNSASQTSGGSTATKMSAQRGAAVVKLTQSRGGEKLTIGTQ
jgi:hypothetical protein